MEWVAGVYLRGRGVMRGGGGGVRKRGREGKRERAEWVFKWSSTWEVDGQKGPRRSLREHDFEWGPKGRVSERQRKSERCVSESITVRVGEGNSFSLSPSQQGDSWGLRRQCESEVPSAVCCHESSLRPREWKLECGTWHRARHATGEQDQERPLTSVGRRRRRRRKEEGVTGKEGAGVCQREEECMCTEEYLKRVYKKDDSGDCVRAKTSPPRYE